MKKLLLGLVLFFIPLFVFSQILEDVIVEKIPATAAAVAEDPTLAGTIAYRVFIDMAPGYELQGLIGKLPVNEFYFETTTEFYNHPDGVFAGRQLSNSLFNNPAGRFDSYVTINGVTSTRVGIPVSDDKDGTADGYTAGKSLSLQSIGTDLESAFGSTPYSGKFTVTDGGYNVLGGEIGPTTDNRVLIGQFTTDGVFSFKINIQIRQINGNATIFVAKNPTGLDYMHPKLNYSSQPGTSPTVSITSPSNGNTFNINTSVPIVAEASDAGGSIIAVEFLVDGQFVGLDDKAPYQFEWMSTQGNHVLTARATDNSGTQTTSAAVNIIIGVPVPPTVSITSPANGATVTAGSELTISATANDADGTVTKVEFLINNNKIGEDLTSPYQINWTAQSGTAEIQAQATDNLGNTSLSSKVTIAVTTVNVPPTVSVTSPANGATVTAGPLNITANASDADGTVSKVEFFVDGAKVGEDASSPYSYSWTSTAGTRAITAKATDNSGAQTTSTAVNITVTATTNVPPTVSVTSPLNGASVEAGLLNITATAADADGSVSKVEFFVDGAKVGEDASSPYSYTWTSTAGTRAITAKATDNSGAQTSSSPVTITITGSGSGTPVVAITSPEAGAQFLTGNVVAIEASASDPDGSVSKVEFLVNGSKVGEDATSPYRFEWTADKTGFVNLVARATDNSGNQAISALIVIQVSGNPAPTVSITSPAQGSTVSAGTIVNIAANAADANGSITKVEFFVNGSKIGEDTETPYQVNWTSVAGTAEITAAATDNQSNKTTSAPVTITITDVSAVFPAVSITSPAGGTTFPSGATIAIAANATDADGSIANVEFFSNGNKIGEDNSSPYQLDWAGTDGSVSLTARATDNTGNQTTSTAVAITVGNHIPNHDTLVFDFSKAIISGNHYQLPVMVISGRAVVSFSFNVLINILNINYHQVVNHTTYLTNNSSFDQSNKKLTISSASQQEIEKNKALLSVSFTLVTGAITPSDLTNFEAYVNNEKCAVKIILPTSPIVPPTIGITSPANGATFNTGAVIQVTAAANDADGSVSLVEFYVNGTKTGEDAASPYQTNWTGVAGTAVLTARATDNKGNQATSAPVTITVTTSGNVPPTASITAPVNGSEYSAGSVVPITVNASDSDGSVVSVEFYINDTKIGKDAVAPYQYNWTAVAGTAVIKSIAVDNNGAGSAPATVTVSVNAQPTVTIVSPAEGAGFTAGQTVTINADALDSDGKITLVEFFVNGIKVGQDDTQPYQFNWISSPGQAKLTAMVTDAKGAKTTSPVVSVFVNIPPSVEITSPANGSKLAAGTIVTIDAEASDPDGSIARVEFYINGNKIGKDSIAPYQANWTGIAGIATVTAVATDNIGAKETSSPVSIEIINPYETGNLKLPCYQDTVGIPVLVILPLSNVIGFDAVVKFESLKVIPTGKMIIHNDLINPSYVDYAMNINTVNGSVALSVFLKSTAPAGTNFNGTGKLFSIEFAKTNAFNSVDSVSFIVNSITESYFTGIVTKAVLPGSLTTYKDNTFTGTLKYWSNSSPIAYNSANPDQYLVTEITGADPSTCQTASSSKIYPDASGIFKFDISNGSAIAINRNISDATEVQSVINGMDAQLTMKTVLDDNSFVPAAYQMIAMDVNMDGFVSSGDVSQINQRSIKMIDEFRQAWNYNNQGIKIVDRPSKDWLFVNANAVISQSGYKISSSYPEDDGKGFSKKSVPDVPSCYPLMIIADIDCPIVVPETFTGIMLGDVNGNYGDIPADGRLKSTKADDDHVVFDMSHASLDADTVEIPVYITSLESIKALDFQFGFNYDKLVFDTIINYTGYIEPTFYFNPEDSILRFTSYSFLNYRPNVNLVSVRFTLLDHDLSHTDLNSVKAWLNGDSVGYLITQFVPNAVQHYNLIPEIRIYPNPANDIINVEISKEASVEIIDMNGRTVSEKILLEANQKKEINLEQLIDGMYMLKFQHRDFAVTKKIIVNKYR